MIQVQRTRVDPRLAKLLGVAEVTTYTAMGRGVATATGRRMPTTQAAARILAGLAFDVEDALGVGCISGRPRTREAVDRAIPRWLWRLDDDDERLLSSAHGLGVWESHWGRTLSPGHVIVSDDEAVGKALRRVATEYCWALFVVAHEKGLLVLLDRKQGEPAPPPLNFIGPPTRPTAPD